MPFQWLQMRITEEKERRAREKRILDRLPDALVELYDSIRSCLESYNKAFGPQASEAELLSGKVRVIAREEREGKWQQYGKVEVSALPSIPGFQVDQGGDPLLIEIGILPGNKLVVPRPRGGSVPRTGGPVPPHSGSRAVPQAQGIAATSTPCTSPNRPRYRRS